MAATAGDISEDWEHVDDEDNFSVISLPTSEDDFLNPARSRPAIARSSSPSNALVPPSAQPQSGSLEQSRVSRLPGTTRSFTTTGKHPLATCVTSTPHVVKSKTPQAKSRDRFSSDSDFDALAETASFSLNLIPEILSGLGSKVQSLHLACEFRATCDRVHLHLGNLQGILHGYAKHQRRSGRIACLPVGLSEWLESLKLELLAIQAMFSAPVPQIRGVMAVLASAHLKKLKGFSSQMDGLMAVIQSDYNDFHALHLPVAMASDERVPSSGRAGYSHPLDHIISGDRNLDRLRRELYALKDQIAEWLGEIQYYEHHGISYIRDQRKTMEKLTNGYNKTKESLGLMLSNHGGDWIEYSIAGGLTYPEFCRLNPDTISSLTLQLKEVTDDMLAERRRAQSIYCRDNTGTSAVSSHQELVISEATMDTLSTIEEVLVSILQVRTCS